MYDCVHAFPPYPLAQLHLQATGSNVPPFWHDEIGQTAKHVGY